MPGTDKTLKTLCVLWVSIAAMKRYGQRQLEGKGVTSAYTRRSAALLADTLSCAPSRGQPGQDLEAGTAAEARKECCFTDLLILHSRHPGVTWPGVALSTSIINQDITPTDLSTRQSS